MPLSIGEVGFEKTSSIIRHPAAYNIRAIGRRKAFNTDKLIPLSFERPGDKGFLEKREDGGCSNRHRLDS